MSSIVNHLNKYFFYWDANCNIKENFLTPTITIIENLSKEPMCFYYNYFVQKRMVVWQQPSYDTRRKTQAKHQWNNSPRAMWIGIFWGNIENKKMESFMRITERKYQDRNVSYLFALSKSSFACSNSRTYFWSSSFTARSWAVSSCRAVTVK